MALLQTIVFYLGFVSSIGAAVGCTLGGVAVPSDVPAFLALFGTGAPWQPPPESCILSSTHMSGERCFRWLDVQL